MNLFDISDLFALAKFPFLKQNILFEKEFAKYLGVKFSIATSFGRTALYLGLRSIGVEDCEVIVPSFTCSVVRQAVIMTGAIPVFVDVDIDTFDLNTEDLKNKITSKTKVIILTHYFGNLATNIEEVLRIARINNILLLEDCAHSLGAEYAEQKIGTFGDLSIFSLTKNLLNFGGGVLVTDNREIYSKAKTIINTEKSNLFKRLLDFPLILSYGLEQITDKVIYDRFRISIFKWWLINLPELVVNSTRRVVIKSLQIPIKSLNRLKHKEVKKRCVEKVKKSNFVQYYEQDINMAPIIASIARNQLKKNDALINKRIIIHDKFKNYIYTKEIEGREIYCKKVCTHLVFRVKGEEVNNVLPKLHNAGISMRGTWPSHQIILDYQNTKNLQRIKNEVMYLTINPGVTKKEVDNLVNVLNEHNFYKPN